MAKCRMLIQENQELGRQLSQGRIAQLEAELALQKKYSEELKGSQDGKRLALVNAPFLLAHFPFFVYNVLLVRYKTSDFVPCMASFPSRAK